MATPAGPLDGDALEHFNSSHNIGPDLEIELFFFAPP
jgi:hypothetical protein